MLWITFILKVWEIYVRLCQITISIATNWKMSQCLISWIRFHLNSSNACWLFHNIFSNIRMLAIGCSLSPLIVINRFWRSLSLVVNTFVEWSEKKNWICLCFFFLLFHLFFKTLWQIDNLLNTIQSYMIFKCFLRWCIRECLYHFIHSIINVADGILLGHMRRRHVDSLAKIRFNLKSSETKLKSVDLAPLFRRKIFQIQ